MSEWDKYNDELVDDWSAFDDEIVDAPTATIDAPAPVEPQGIDYDAAWAEVGGSMKAAEREAFQQGITPFERNIQEAAQADPNEQGILSNAYTSTVDRFANPLLAVGEMLGSEGASQALSSRRIRKDKYNLQEKSWVESTASIIVESIASAGALASTGGLPGLLTGIGLESYGETKRQAIRGGATEEEAKKMARGAAAFETGVTAAFQLAGLGGMEGAFLKSTGWQGIKKFGVQVASEMGEEQLVTLGQNLATQGNTGSPKDYANTAVQVIGTMGLVGGSQKIANFVNTRSRSAARKAGIPPEMVSSQKQRDQLADSIQANMPPVEPEVTPEPTTSDAAVQEYLDKYVTEPEATVAPPAAPESTPAPAPEIVASVTKSTPREVLTFDEMNRRSDNLQKQIDDLHDALESQGIRWEDQKNNPKLKELYDKRISLEEGYLADLRERSIKAVRKTVSTVPPLDEGIFDRRDPSKWLAKYTADDRKLRTLLSDKFGIGSMYYFFAESKAFENKQKTTEQLSESLMREWALQSGFDADGLLGRDSGLTDIGKAELVGWFGDAAGKIFDTLVEQVVKGTSADTNNRQVPSQQRLLRSPQPEIVADATTPPPQAPTEPPNVIEGPAPTGRNSPYDASSSRHAWTREDREFFEMAGIDEKEVASFPQDKANAIEQGVPERALDIATAVIEKPRALSNTENAGMVLRYRELVNQYEALQAGLKDSTDIEDAKLRTAQLNRVFGEMETINRALDLAGTEGGRWLNARKFTIDRFGDLASVKIQGKVNAGRELKPQEESKLDAAFNKHDRAKKAVEKLEQGEKKKLHREVARVKSAISNIRQAIGLDKQKLGNVDVPGLTTEEQATVDDLRKKLDEAEKQLENMDKLPVLDRVHNRPSEKIISDIDDSIAKVRAIIASKTVRAAKTKTDLEIEQQKVKAIERQIEAVEKELQDPENVKRFNYDVASERRTELKKQLQELQAKLKEKKPTPSSFVESDRIEALKRQIAKADEDIARLRQGLPALKSTGYDVASKRRTELKEELKERRKIIAELTPRPEPTSAEVEQRKIKSLERQLAKIEEQLASPENVQQFRDDVASQRRTELKQQIKEANARLREKQPPPSSLVEIRKIKALEKTLEKLQKTLADAKQGIVPAKKMPGGDVPTNRRVRLMAELKKTRRDLHEAIGSLKPKEPWDYIVSLSDLMRGLKGSIDFSALGKQAKLAIGHPVLMARAARDMFRAAKSDQEFERQYQTLMSRHNAIDYERTDLAIQDMDTDLDKREEFVASELLRRIPGIRASQRAYIAVLNRLRADYYDVLKDGLGGDAVLSWEDKAALSHTVKVFTGRGTWKRIDPDMRTWATILWSPRLYLARAQFLIGEPIWNATPATRKAVAKEYLRTFVGLGAIYSLYAIGLMAMEDDENEFSLTFDPRSPDFGKPRIGDTRIDPMGGLAQFIRFAGQAVTGEEVDASGKVKQLSGYHKFGKLANFARSKLAPLPATAINVYVGENYDKEPVGITSLHGAWNLLKEMGVPLSVSDFNGARRDLGIPRALLLDVINLFGETVHTHEPKK